MLRNVFRNDLTLSTIIPCIPYIGILPLNIHSREKRAMRLLAMFLVLVMGLSVIGCEDTDPEADFDEPVPEGPVGLKIVKGENGPDFPDAKFAISSPAADEVITSDSIMITTSVAGVELKAPTVGEGANGLAYSADGQHIHVIIDDNPYMAKYDETFSIGTLEPGPHTLRAFPSRSWHESVKTPGVFVARTFYVGEKTGEPVLQEDQPLLTYSRPKGTYVGDDARKVMLDFYIANCELGPDAYKVVASIDGKVMDTLTEWRPYYIEGLKKGEHTIGLKLIGPDGNLVPNGPFNDVEQKITVKDKEKPKEEASTEVTQEEKDMYDVMRHSQGL